MPMTAVCVIGTQKGTGLLCNLARCKLPPIPIANNIYDSELAIMRHISLPGDKDDVKMKRKENGS